MKRKVVVVGAGISGLARGFALKEQSGDQVDLKILEACDRPGGWIKTLHLDGFLFEQGPRSLRTKGAGVATLKLIEKLGLIDDVIVPSKDAEFRYLYTGQKLQKLPSSLFSFFTSPLMKGVIPAFLKEWGTPFKKNQDLSIREFIGSRLGYSVADRLFDPLVSGIFAGDTKELSMRACFPDLYEMVNVHGSLGKAAFSKLFMKKTNNIGDTRSPFVDKMQRYSMFSLSSGLETLVKKMAESLEDNLKFNTPVQSIHVVDGRISLDIGTSQPILCDELHLSLPAHAVSKLLKKSNNIISCEVGKIKSASIATVNVAWDHSTLDKKGFGYLIPSSEQEDILGVVWDSSAFPCQNGSRQETRLTAMIGGMQRPDLVELNDDKLLDIVRASLYKHLGINELPSVSRVSRCQGAIPQYRVGHLDLVKSIEEELSRWSKGSIHLLGSSWHGVSVNDCIAGALRLPNSDTHHITKSIQKP